MIRLAYLVAGAVWLMVSLLPRGATLIYLWPWPLVLALSLLVPPVALAWRLARGEAIPRLGGAADWAVLALLLALGAAALLSPFRTASLCLLQLPLATLCLPYELQRLRSDAADLGASIARGFAWMLVLFSIVSLGMWFVLIALPNGFHHLWQARNVYPLGHPNYTAGALLLLLPFGLAKLAEPGPRSRILWGLASLAGLFCLFTAGSRAALLGLAAGGAMAGLLLVRSGWCSRRRALWLVALCFAGTVVFALVNPRVRELLRPPATGAVPDDSTIQRAAMFEAGRLMIAQRPFLGWGPGTTPLVYPRFRKELSGGVDTALQLHNGPLQIAADAGLAGLAALLLLLAAAARACWRSCAPASIPGRLPLAAVAGTALAAYGAFALYDFELDVPFFSLGGAVCFALLFPRQSATSALPRWPALAVLGLVLALAVVPKIPQLRSHALLAEASDQLENNNPVAFHDLALRASRADRSDTEALNAVAFQLAEMGRSGENPARRTHLIEDAGNRFVESLARNPDQEICETNLAWLLLPNEPARAESHFLAAAALVPEKNGLGLGLARAQLALHRRDAAVQALTTEGLIDPRFLLSPLWREAPFAELRQPVLAAVANRADHLAPEAALAPWQRAELLYLAEFARWLDGTASPGDVVRVALNPEQRAFFGTDEPGKFLVRLAEAKPDEVVRFRAQRPGYGVLTRNLDAPLPADFYESSQYQFVLKEVAFLLPERLNLPGRILLAEFARISSSPP